MRRLLLLLPCTLLTSAALAQGSPSQRSTKAVMVSPDQVTWSPAPPVLPAGAKVAVLEGDPSQDAPFTMRVSFPDGYRIPPHSHPAAERVTVIEGTFRLGMGDKFDASALHSMPAGSYVSMQPGTHHFAQAKGKAVVQINGVGPWKLTYVNPEDDPSKSKP